MTQAGNEVLYEVRDTTAVVTLNRPRYKNAQSWALLDGLDAALDRAVTDDAVKVIVVRGAGDHFSSGHDLGTPEQRADREARGVPDQGIEFYDNFRKYNLDLTVKWRNLQKPTIAMVRGWCIYGGWMIAAEALTLYGIFFADKFGAWGAIGGLLMIMLWMNIVSQVLFYGAELCKVMSSQETTPRRSSSLVARGSPMSPIAYRATSHE